MKIINAPSRFLMPGAIALVLGSLLTGCSSLTVRVDPAGGAPRLVVNGEPVRARMFWGWPGSAPLPVLPTWQEVKFEFVASGSATNGTMHFRFGHTPGDIYFDDLRVVDLDHAGDIVLRSDFENGMAGFQRDWTFWPSGKMNTVGEIEIAPNTGRANSAALHVKLHAPPDGNWPDFHIYCHPRLSIIEGHRYRVSFWARAEGIQKIMVAFYQLGQHYLHLGGPADVFEQQIKLAANVGINFVSFPIGLPWPKPGTAVNWAGVDKACEHVLQANPKVLMLPRIGMDPPAWWCEAHPDEVMCWENGQRKKAVPASPQYRRDAAERLAALVTHLEEKFGDHIAGYHPVGQNTGEWFYEDTWEHPLNGYAPADRIAWQQWRAARNLPAADVPSAKARHAAPAGIFRDPVVERTLIEWADFQQQMMADCVCGLAHTVREASHGKKLVVFFYGYLFEFAVVHNGPATAGHYALRRLLNCPDIDVLCSPISYRDRGLGQGAPSMTAAESVALAGKMWLNEDDTRTYLATDTPPGWLEHVTTLEETNAELTRNVAQEALRNFGTWWMDLGASGWFNDPGMWAAMQRLQALDEPLLKHPTPFRPEVAAVIDERSMLRVAAGGTAVTGPAIFSVRAPLGRMGAPFGQYLLDDVMNGRVQAKLYVFLNAWSLSAAERERLLQATRGATRIWCYAPGYFEGDRIALDAMRQLTGFELKKVTPKDSQATPTEAGMKLGLQQIFGAKKPVQPLFAAADATGGEVLATYPDGSAAAALRRSADGASIFVGAPGLTSELLRAAARAAGVHLFTETDCNVYASGSFVVLHAAQNGSVELDVGRRGPISDVLTGSEVGQGPKISLPLKFGETRILRY